MLTILGGIPFAIGIYAFATAVAKGTEAGREEAGFQDRRDAVIAEGVVRSACADFATEEGLVTSFLGEKEVLVTRAEAAWLASTDPGHWGNPEAAHIVARIHSAQRVRRSNN